MSATRMLAAEARKVKWIVVMLLIAADIGASFMLASQSVRTQTEYFAPDWNTLYFQAVLFHGMFFLPLFAGLFAAFLCAYEHKNGAWKQILTLPYPRRSIFLAKFRLLALLLGGVQLLFLLGYLLCGKLIQVEGAVPWEAVLGGIAAGWAACLPLAMLQLGLSVRMKSFGAALLVSISMVIPNIVITGLPSFIGAWFPFAPPYYAMFPRGLNLSPRLEPISFTATVVSSFLLYTAWGLRSFARKDWA